MKILVACEFSGIVRDAFRKLGHDAWSCDILDSKIPDFHIKGDVREILNSHWDLLIGHPPCTHLCVSGARHWKNKLALQKEAIDFFYTLMNAPIKSIAIENPVGIMSTVFRKPDQYIHPYFFGDPVSKKTGLWLKNLPLLIPTNIVQPKKATTKSGKSYDKWWLWTSSLPVNIRGHVRSITFQGIANAMAEQWGHE